MKEWTEVKRTGEMEFRLMLKSKRLSRMLAEVWQSLPVKDRNAINDRLVLVSDVAAFRCLFADRVDYHLYGCAVPFEENNTFIFLNASTTGRKNAAFVRYVIAHELAHVYHNHRGSGKRRRQEQEAEADATAARWGYPDTDPLPKLTIKRVKLPADVGIA